MDYSEFLAQDYDDIRIPENALRVKFSKSSFAFEAIAVPVIETFELPFDRNNPWAVSVTLGLRSQNIQQDASIRDEIRF